MDKEKLPDDQKTKKEKFHDPQTHLPEGQQQQESMADIPEGHPADTFRKENKEILKTIKTLNRFYERISTPGDIDPDTYLIQLKALFNNLADVEKHYLRQEKLLFPCLERYNITGPPKEICGMHDKIRELIHDSFEELGDRGKIQNREVKTVIDQVLRPASDAVAAMVLMEEEVLLPMCMDKLSELEWYELMKQSNEIGYCLYIPETGWKPAGIKPIHESKTGEGKVQLPTGRISVNELNRMLNALPVEITFIDNQDKIRYFSGGQEQIFKRTAAVLGRDVRMCHPPRSVQRVEKIINDFKSGKQDRAVSWIKMEDRLVHIEYLAIRDENNEYMGVTEVVQDVAPYRELQGEQRLLKYKKTR